MARPCCVFVMLILVAVTHAQCPEFSPSPAPQCDQRTDHELCVLAAHKDSDRLADFEFMNVMNIATADPLACKLRMAAIRQHVIFHGEKGHGSTNCKRAAAIFKTNSLTNTRISDVCEQIGFSKCSPHCRHGGKVVSSEDGSCGCECSGGWSGKDCSSCSMLPSECFHDGTVVSSANTCECNCVYPWTGVHCEQCNRRCQNGGTVSPTDEKCNCQCNWPWTGVECETCDIECFHGGRLTKSSGKCECQCPILSSGPQCEQCSARCLNGGVLDKDSCSCKCVGGFTGPQCEICDVKCQHNSTFIPNECGCKCNNPYTSGPQCEACSNTCHGRGREVGCSCVDCQGYWTGPSCNNCTLSCVNEGELDHRSCKCACDKSRCRHGKVNDDCSCQCSDFWRGETCDECHLNCLHGTLDRANCTCTCDGSWTGVKCDTCGRNCSSQGILDASKCVCTDCQAPYHGYDCRKKCTKTCLHGSQMHAESCTCERCPLPWFGDQCQHCKLLVNRTMASACKHGTFDSTNCRCDCAEGWGGERCDRCTRVCAHGTLNTTDCSCSCSDYWTGLNCSECQLDCQNGGTLDRDRCYCECDHLHSGSRCQGGPCHMQQACDSCLSISDGCEWCGQTSQCSKKPAPGVLTQCVGPFKRGICPTYGECHVCDYSGDELSWLSLHGDKSLGTGHLSLMPEPVSTTDPLIGVCDPASKKTWCSLKHKCVEDWIGGEDGPCQPMDERRAAPAGPALNGFVSSEGFN